MPLVQNFTTSQTLGVPDSINFEDTSTGADAAIVSRKIYLLTSYGTYLVQSGTTTDYEIWALGSTTITLKVLPKDYALTVKVEWVGVSGVVLYSKTVNNLYTLYNETFDLGLGQSVAGNPLLMNDNTFQGNKSKFRDFIDSSNNAILYLGLLNLPQLMIDEATKMRVNSKYLFNINS